jgi:4-aminobutyrate aminotransferase
VSCAAALTTLDLVEREFMANARVQGERLMAGVRRLADKHRAIGEVRGRGLMIGIEFVADRATRAPHPDLVARLERLAFSKGLLLLGAGKSSLRLAPPLVVDDYDVDTALSILDQCIAELS